MSIEIIVNVYIYLHIYMCICIYGYIFDMYVNTVIEMRKFYEYLKS